MDMYAQTTHVHTYVHYIGTVVYSIGNLKAIKDADIANSSKEISWVCRLTLSGIMKVKVDKIPGQEIIKCIHTVSMLMRMFTDWSNYCTCRYVKEPLLDLECYGLLQVSKFIVSLQIESHDYYQSCGALLMGIHDNLSDWIMCLV